MTFESRAGEFDDAERLASRSYDLPELPWQAIAGRLEAITIKVLKFDARLEASGLSTGWQSRCDMTEAVRALILDGHMLDVGDLVLHDAGMDVRHPTHELTRAAAALRARRTALARKAPWPLSIDGLAALRGIGGLSGEAPRPSQGKRPNPEDDEAYPPYANDADPWKAHLAEIDALLDRTNQVLAGETPLPKSRSHLVYDPDQDEAEAEDLWLDVVKRTSSWPAVAAAAVAWQAWLDLNLYTRLPWLGLIMAAAILRARGLTSHLLPLAAGFKQSKFRPQGREGATEKLEGFCQVLEEALAIAHKDLDRLILARALMRRVTKTCRSNSKLPELVELFLSRPLVTVPLGAKLLKVTPKAVDLMLAQLGGALPRELTGRTRYRAWGIV
ncbi:RHE_PE00001 family protein [Microvirga sp. P5_D2]